MSESDFRCQLFSAPSRTIFAGLCSRHKDRHRLSFRRDSESSSIRIDVRGNPSDPRRSPRSHKSQRTHCFSPILQSHVAALPHLLVSSCISAQQQAAFGRSPPTTTRPMACSIAPAAPHRMFHHVAAAPHQMMRAPPPVAAPAPAPEKMTLSDFDWLGDLGAGGFALVCKARHRRTGEVFALKVSFDADPDMEAEAKVLGRAAGSPHVIDCYAFLRGPRGEPAFLLEFMDAGSLGRILCRRRGRGLPEAALAEAAAQCVVGLAQLHSRGVAHLDVKPGNFLANSRGEIKIADFNSSRILYGSAGERLQVPITCGTSCYFSPERFAPRAHAGPHGAMAADVWGLGITVLELFLCRYAVEPVASIEEAICHGEPPRVPDEAEASAELRGFVAACLQKEPARRATVPQLLGHPFLTRRDVEASRRALREIIVETL